MATRPDTARDHRERINRAIFHLEAHLDDPVQLEALARISCFSPYHFHRIFTAYAGETLGELVRRLRLERAARHLRFLDAPVTEIGLAAGYETPSAFGRAFAAHFGMSPTEYRRSGGPPPDGSAHPLALTGDDQETPAMTPAQRTIDPIPVIFVRRTGPYALASKEAFTALWAFAGPRGLVGPDARMIGLSHDDPNVTDEGRCRYDACLSVDPGRPPRVEGEVGQKTIAGGRYAVFLHQGPYERLQQTFDAIFKGWLPRSGEQLREAPCFELYLNTPVDTPPDALRTEIWLPLQ